MYLIFLDIDGVLNTAFTYHKIDCEYYRNGKILSEIDEHRVKYLKEIVEATGAKIVISSSWKKYIKKEGNKWIPNNEKGFQLINEFKKQNVEIYDTISNEKDRQKAVKEYLLEHPEIEKYVIIDDEPSLFKDFDGKEEFVKTSIKTKDELVKDMTDCYGLCYEHVEKIINYFNNTKKLLK